MVKTTDEHGAFDAADYLRSPADAAAYLEAVLEDAGVVNDPDTLFPLQAALGYDIAQNLFIGNRNIVVEGVSDFIYLSTISDQLSSLGRASLPESARLLPAGGATNIPTFLALLGSQLDVVVLLDGNSDKQKIENTIKRGRLDAARVISLDNFASASTPASRICSRRAST